MSDVGLLVSFEKPVSYFKIFHIEEELNQILSRKIDLVTEDSINYKINPFVDRDKKTIYERGFKGWFGRLSERVYLR